MRNRFINPANGQVYDWPINHSEEEEAGQEKNIEHGGTTNRVGLVRQQGDPAPYVLRYSGTILNTAQFQAMTWWTSLTNYQSIHFRDFDDNLYEVIITQFKPTRHRTLRNPRDQASAPLHFWRYTIEMEVLRFISGDLVGMIW
jgi:hypothetical protein